MAQNQNQKNNAPARPPANRAGAANDKTRVQASAKPAGSKPKPRKKRKKAGAGAIIGRVFLNIAKATFVMLCIGLMVVSVVAVQVVQYVVSETQNDDNILDLENIKLNQTSYIMALNHENPNAEQDNDYIQYQELVGPEHRIWVQLSDIPKNLQLAVIATEDREFENHHGVNFQRSAYALANEFLGLEDRTFGASTITQQLVKNITGDDVVTTEGGDRSSGYQRKMREMFRAWGLENRYSKDMIMEAYLNTMGLSETIAGVQAGALEYFGKNVKDLNLAECATVAGITQKPTSYSPFQNPENCLKRRNDVLYFMWECGYITQQEFDAAVDEPLGVTKRVKTDGETVPDTIFNYFSDTVFNEVVRDLMEQKGYTRKGAIDYIYTGGLRIYATVDQKVQLALEDIYLDGYDPENGWFLTTFPGYEQWLTETDEEGNKVLPQSACAVLNYDGELVAVIGGIGPKTESLSLNRAVGTLKRDPLTGELVRDAQGNAIVDGTVRQVGSTMKPIAAYALGIDFGIINYSKTVLDAGVLARDPSNPTNRDWPKNFSDTYRNRNIPICSAIAESTNTVAAQVGLWVGREPMFEFLRDTLEISSLEEPHDVDIAPLVLGSMTHGMSAYELAGAYMMFGGNETYGVHNSLHCYSKVVDSKGNIVLEPEITTVQAISPETGFVMNRLLSNVIHAQSMPEGAYGTAYGMWPEGDMDAVAKTGTTSDDRDRWLVGLTPYYVTAVWWGYDQEYDFYGKWQPTARTNIPPNVWVTLMNTVQADLPYKEFPARPEGVQELAFCLLSGELAGPNCPRMTGYYTPDGIPDPCTAHINGVPAEPEPA